MSRQTYLCDYAFNFLKLSTSHVPKETADALGHDCDSPMGALLWADFAYAHWSAPAPSANRETARSDYGWIFYVSSDQADAFTAAGHPELGALIHFADAHGFTLLMLDCDADPLPAEAGLPTFEWKD